MSTAMVKRPIARLRALRALAEGAHPSIELLADVSGRSPRCLRLLAVREEWNLTPAASADIHNRIRPIVSKLLDKLEAVSERAAEEEGRMERGEIDAVLTMLRAIDKINEIQRPEEAVAKKQKQDDEDLATVLERINERIIALARALADQMVAQDRAAATGASAGRGVGKKRKAAAIPAAGN